MYRLRSRIWDTQEKKFFVPYYQKTSIGKLPDVKEILLTQNGDVMYRERIDGIETLTDDITKRFIKNGQVGIKDRYGNKYYFNDIVKITTSKMVTDDKRGLQKIVNESFGVLIWYSDRLGIASGPIDNYTAIDPISEKELRVSEKVGNIYQNHKIIMGDEPVND